MPVLESRKEAAIVKLTLKPNFYITFTTGGGGLGVWYQLGSYDFLASLNSAPGF